MSLQQDRVKGWTIMVCEVCGRHGNHDEEWDEAHTSPDLPPDARQAEFVLEASGPSQVDEPGKQANARGAAPHSAPSPSYPTEVAPGVYSDLDPDARLSTSPPSRTPGTQVAGESGQ